MKSRLVKFIFAQKFRFDLGHSVLQFIYFTLLLIAASDKIKAFFGIERTVYFVAAAVVAGYGGVWLFGLFLDRVLKYNENYSNAQHARNPHALENYERLKRIEEIVSARGA